MSLDTDLSLLLLWAVTDSDSNSTERMSALKANDGWCLTQVMSLNQPYVILTGRQELRCPAQTSAYLSCSCLAIVE